MIASTSTWVQIAVGAITGMLVLLIPFVVKFLVGIFRDVHDIKCVLITPAPTPLVPNPPKGLVDVVAGLAYTAAASLTGTAALVKEKSGNGQPHFDTAQATIETEQSRLDEGR